MPRQLDIPFNHERKSEDLQSRYDSQLFRMRQRTTRYLAFAIAQASRRLARSAAGQSVFTDPLDLQNCQFIVKMLPTIFDHLPIEEPESPSPLDP